MLIPSKVKIGGCTYNVIVEDKDIILNGRQCKGMIDYEFHTIKIDSSVQDKQGQAQTFLHELIHGIIYERSLDLEKCDEERITDEIAIGLHQVIVDNDDLFVRKVVVNNNGVI